MLRTRLRGFPHGDALRDEVRVRVLIADDSEEVRALMRRILGLAPEMQVVAEASDGAEAVRLAAELQPDVILLDLAMPVMDGLTALPEVRRVAPATRVVVVSSSSAAEFGDVALRRGAHVYLEKSIDPDNLLKTLRDTCPTGPPA